jgi:hypothetical protein
MRATGIGLCATLLCVHAAWAQEPARTDGWVVLPVDEYRALRSRAFPTTPDPAPPPVDATLSRVEYDLRLTGETATGQARLTIDVLKQGWVSVQTPPGVLVRDARLDGRPTRLVSDVASAASARSGAQPRGGSPRVLISRAGRATLSLDIVVPLAASAGTESMTLPPSSSALSAVTLVIPRLAVELSVTGGVVAQQAESVGESRWVVYGNADRPMVFAWKRKADDRRATLPLRTRARVTEIVALGEDASQVTASVRLEVVQGVARQIELALPDGLTVDQVAGATVSDWTQQAGVLAVTFLEPVTAETSVVITAEARTPRDGAVTVPLIRLPLAEREGGGVAIDVVGPGEIADRQPRGLEPADVSDLGDIVAGRESPSMVAFQYRPLPGTAPRALTLTVSRYSPQAVLVANVEEARYDALLGEDGKTLVRARYAVRNNQRTFLAVSLPAQSVLWSASLAGQPVRPGLSGGGALLLPLQKGRSGEDPPTFVIELVYLQRAVAWNDKGEAHLDLPAVDLPVSRTGLTLHHSPRFHVEPRPGIFRVENDPGPWNSALRIGAVPPPESKPSPVLPSREIEPSKDFKLLMDHFQKEAGRTRQGALPIEVVFPDFGPALFLAAELTAETRGPSLDIAYKRGGDR